MRLAKEVLWVGVASPGAERCGLWEYDDGWILEGTAVTAPPGGRPFEARYRLSCSPGWETRAVDLAVVGGGKERRLGLVADRGRWWVDAVERPDLEGCIDVDLGVSPSTNTLPIRRLDLPVDASAEVAAAWVRFPELEVARLDQRYTNLGDGAWRYESGTFSAELLVDSSGLVVRYAGGWERAAPDFG